MNHAETTPRRPARITIEDVASVAGVSVATVSRALRNLPNVAASTRERIQAIAGELGYRADPVAKRLATGKSQAIGVVLPFLNTWYFSSVVAGVEAVCNDADYDTIVIVAGTADHRRRLVEDADGILRRVDAIVLVDLAYNDAELEALASHGLDIVAVGPRSNVFPSVGIDDLAVGRMAAEHLIGLGHERIGVLRGQLYDPLEFEVPKRRLAGIEEAFVGAGIDVDESIWLSGNFSIGGGYEATQAMLEHDSPPTAILALSDEMAFGAIVAARDLRVAVPGRLSVIGVDDHEMSEVVDLTTVRQRVPDHGAHAARQLLERLEGAPRTSERFTHEVDLIVRGTTAPPPT